MLGEVERQRAPTTAEVEDPHAVAHPGAFAGELEHRVLGIVEGLDAVGPVTTAVLAALAHEQGHEVRRQFVVLLVGLGRDLGDRARRHMSDHVGEPGLLAGHAPTRFVALTGPRAELGTEPEGGVGKDSGPEGTVEQGVAASSHRQ